MLLFKKPFSALPMLLGIFMLVSVSPRAAQALMVIPNAERTAVLSEVFGVKVAHGIADLNQARFKGAAEFALNLAMEVKHGHRTLEDAQAELLNTLKQMDEGTIVAIVPDPEVEVVGIMPVGESVANRLEPGAGQILAVSGIAKTDEAPETVSEPIANDEPAAEEAAPALEAQSVEEPAAAPTQTADDEALDRNDEERGLSSTHN